MERWRFDEPLGRSSARRILQPRRSLPGGLGVVNLAGAAHQAQQRLWDRRRPLQWREFTERWSLNLVPSKFAVPLVPIPQPNSLIVGFSNDRI
jgi:hypothetical protein